MIRPSKRDFPHGFCAWGNRDQCIPRPRPQPQGHRESFRRDGNKRHDQGKQASKRPFLDRPQTRIDESHHPRRQLPDSSHHASSRKYGPSKEPPSAPPKSSPSPQFDVPQADLLEAGWPLLSQLAGRQGDTRWGETQPGPSRTHKRHQTAQSRHAQTRAVKIPSGTSDCLLKFRCCSNHPSPLGLGRTGTRTSAKTTNALNSPSPNPFRHGAWLFPKTRYPSPKNSSW